MKFDEFDKTRRQITGFLKKVSSYKRLQTGCPQNVGPLERFGSDFQLKALESEFQSRSLNLRLSKLEVAAFAKAELSLSSLADVFSLKITIKSNFK